jgi:branched-chain amino acid aminotransferase
MNRVTAAAKGIETMATEMKIWIDGAIVDAGEAKISVLDHGLLYGDGIFEGIRIYGARILRLEDHLRRLATGAKAIGLELPGGLAEVERIVLETAREFGQSEAYIRLLVTRGEGALGVDPTLCKTPRIICIVTQVALYPSEKLERGIDLVTVSVRRPGADVLDPAVKSLNYLNSVLAKREARLRGADEGLILNQAGMVAEASVANVFAVRDGIVKTPPVTDGALPGITRASVMEMAADHGHVVREVTLGRYDLLGADEVFLCGSGARIVPVATLDQQSIGEPGPQGRPVTTRLIEDFPSFAEARGTPFD